METIYKTKKTHRRAIKAAFCWMPLAVGILAVNPAQAHLTYSGRDWGSFSGLTNGTASITNQTVTGNYGWADAADGVLGDSHRGRAFRFHLDNAAFVTFTLSANPKATATSLGGFTPAFSLYSGLAAVAPFPPSQTTNAASADHDFSTSSVAWRIWWIQQYLNPSATDESATDGSWNAVGDWKIGGDGDLVTGTNFDQLTSFTYKGSAKSWLSGGTVSGNFSLPAGDYTILVGGNDIANKTSDTALSGFGIAATLSVSPTPVVGMAQRVFVGLPAGMATNWLLQTSTNMADWVKAPYTPVVVDGQPGVVLDPGASQQYFRLNFVP